MAGATRLADNAYLYLINNVFEDGIGTNRPIIHYYTEANATQSIVWRSGNITRGSDALIWDRYSYEGNPGRVERSVGDGPPHAHLLELTEVARVRPDACFWGWDARATLAEARQQ